ncbi:MAG: hypothetical protein ACPGC4_01200 [Litorivicinaceae bacterium]
MASFGETLSRAFSDRDPEGSGQTIGQSFEPVKPEPESGPVKPDGPAETIKQGLSAGVQGMTGQALFFKALVQDLSGDSEAAAESIERGERASEQAAAATAGIQSFDEALKEGTFSAIGEQGLKFFGEGIPSIVTSLAGWGGGTLVGLGLRGVSKSAGERILKDTMENLSKGTASPEEMDLARELYELARTEYTKSAMKTGGLAGAAASEFPLLAGSNLQEGLEINPEMSDAQSERALGLAFLQTPLAVLPEKFLLDAFGKKLKAVADKRSKGEGSIFGRLALSLEEGAIFGAAAEGASEAAQEGVSVLNRMKLDDQYTVEQGLMRLGESAFAGAAVGAPVRAGSNTTAQIFGEARNLLKDGFDQRVAQQSDKEEFGDLDTGMSTPESRETIDAQIDAVFDDSSSKQAVWVEGVEPFEGATEGLKEATINGKQVFTAFVPGRGTIISPNADVVQQVIQEEASDESLASVLGFSSSRPDGADRVVQVTDAEGRVVSEEATNREGQAGAVQAGDRLMPKGGDVRVVSVQEALRERNVQEMRMVDEDVDDQTEQAETSEQQDVESTFQTREIEPELIEQTDYASRKDTETLFENTQTLRDAFEEEFGTELNIDWTQNYWGRMSDRVLQKAVEARRQGLDVEFEYSTAENKHRVKVYNYGESFTTQRAGKTVRVPLAQFLAIEVGRARDSKMARDNPVTIEKDGKVSRTNLVDLMNAGRRINQTREGSSFEEGRSGLAAGLTTIIGELATNGYKLQVRTRNGNNVDLNTVLDDLVRQSTLDARFARENPEAASRGEFPPRLPTIAALSSVTLGEGPNGRPLTIGSLLRPRGGESAPTTPLQNDDDVVRSRIEIPAERRVSRVGPKTIEEQRGEEKKGQNEVVDETLEPLPYEDETIQEGMSDTDRISDQQGGIRQGSIGFEGDIEPTPVPGVDGPAKYPPPTSRPKKPSARKTLQATYPFGAPSDEGVRTLLSIALRYLKMTRPLTIIEASQLDGLSREEVDGKLNMVGFYDLVQQKKEDGVLAWYYNRKDAGHIIVINPQAMSEAENPSAIRTAMIVAHELGHAFMNEELENLRNKPELLNRLYKAFMRDMANPELRRIYDVGYTPEQQFSEWYADQVAKAVRGEFKKPRNWVQRFFKTISDRLQTAWNQMERFLKVRLGGEVSPTFEQYMDGVLEARSKSRTPIIGIEPTIYVSEVNAQYMKQPGAEGRIDVWRAKFRSALNQNKALLSVILTADGQLRSISTALADLFYTPAQAPGRGGSLGFIRSYYNQFRQFRNDFEKEVGDLNDPEVQAAVELASIDGPIPDGNPKAQAVRDFLAKIHRDYIEPSQQGYADQDKIGFQEDYFPVMLDLAAIADDPETFINLILRSDPKMDETALRNSVKRIVKYQKAIVNGQEIEVNDFEPAEGRVEARQLTRNADLGSLRDAGFMRSSDVALSTYLRQIAKRVEWNKATKDEQGNSRMKPLLDGLNVQDREFAEKIIATYLGHQTEAIAPWLRKLNSWGQFLQFVTILPFSAIASFPELAGPILNSKEFAGFEMAWKEMKRQFLDRESARRFARDIGVVADEAMAGAWVSEADLDYMDPVARNWSDKFFKAIGLDFFTRFTREFAAGMSMRFLHEHAFNPKERSDRYLRDLGVTADEVKAFFNGGQNLDSPEGQKVKQASRKFVESSILRPNAAERPLWGSDPRFALIWQLKGYFYAFYKVIIQGTQREAQVRAAEGASLPAVAAVYALAAVPFMALAMVSMEAREWAKEGLSTLLPFTDDEANYFRSDNMSWGDYSFEVFDRAGFLGPWTMATMMHQNAQWDQNALLPLLGPTAETIDTVLRDGWSSVPNRLVPIYNQLKL